MGIDWDAFITNQSLGIDVPTSLAGSIIDEPTAPGNSPAGPDPQSPNSPNAQARRNLWMGLSIGTVLAILYALVR
jgi:hypothetical protein